MGLIGDLFNQMLSGDIDPDDVDWDDYADEELVCEHCGAHYRFEDAQSEYESYFHGDLSYTSEIREDLCGSCAIEETESEIEPTYEDCVIEDDDEDDSERLSASDAALIWASNGKDEDYMFGYSEEELEDSL